MKRTFKLGKIAYNGRARKTNAVEITVELRNRGGDATFTIGPNKERIPTGKNTPEYVELSISGDIWNARHTDIWCGGQCLDTIAVFRNQFTPANQELFDLLYDLWKKYHLNGMHAGTPIQEAFIAGLKTMGFKYDYKRACILLKDAGLYEVEFTGKTIGRMYDHEPYKYGSAWVIEDLPGDVLLKVEHLIMTGEEAENHD